MARIMRNDMHEDRIFKSGAQQTSADLAADFNHGYLSTFPHQRTQTLRFIRIHVERTSFVDHARPVHLHYAFKLCVSDIFCIDLTEPQVKRVRLYHLMLKAMQVQVMLRNLFHLLQEQVAQHGLQKCKFALMATS